MMLAILILAIWHPGQVLVGPESEFPKMTRKEKMAAKAAEKAEKAEKAQSRAERQGER
jgi:Na+-transporting methylmalonyl-CoA/oxaloacetate decarboxylase gamma subunit